MYHITITDLDTQEIEVDMDTSLIMGIFDNPEKDCIGSYSYAAGISGYTYLCGLMALPKLMETSAERIAEEYGVDAMGAIDWLQHTTEEGG